MVLGQFDSAPVLCDNKVTEIMERNMRHYTSTQYKDLGSARLGEGHDWFRIKRGDYVQVRGHHDLNSSQDSAVLFTDRKTVTFELPDSPENPYPFKTVGQDSIFRVRRPLKTKTVKAVFPENWVSDDLVACEHTARTLRVYDLKLTLKITANIDGEKHFKLSDSRDNLFVDGWIEENGHTTAHAYDITRESYHWADACVKIIANIY
jgi:hypothetical protein